ncbi:MAG TPA: CHASE2 domain-containing protein [Nostoc sp.]|uniref:CHASE2 domain-containing protein n=1 Tax=Nostoc sp. TaxID=1180 RepID=UPI002D5253A9|nr:CHASE2 domain-containing protein [Nostoc sp.]HYX15617.1 CHASE2 domain-containing protein [Nostoc sp.]
MWEKLKKSLKKWQGTLIITPCVAGLVIAGSNIGVFRILEWVTLDQLFRIHPQEAIDKRIVIVTIDEPDIQYVKQWPMSDRVMAKMIRNIKAQQPRAIAIDIYRDLPVEPGHAELVKEFQNTPNFIGIEKIAGKPVAPPPILAKQSQVAANDLLLDTDGKIRRGIILLGKPDQSLAQGLGVKLALTYLEKAGIELKLINADKQIYGLGKAKFVPLSSNDGQYNEADMGGYQVLINYRGGLDSFTHISMTDILENRIPANFIRDRLVLVGAKAPSLNDSYSTPYNSNLLFPTELVPGVVVHANLTSQILSAAIDGRPMMRATVKPLNWFLIIFWSRYSATLGTIYIKKRWLTIGGLLLAVVIIFSSAYIAFLGGWLIPVFTPLLTVISALIIGLVQVLWKNLMLSYRQLEDYAHNLEIKVQERTAELAEANEEINILNEKLKGENLRMSAELDIIRRMQQMILPKPEELEAIEGLDIAGFMEAADEVGGDYYDVLHIDGVVTLGIGDVTGHGLESGLLMLMTQTAVRLLKEIRESDSVRFFDTLNRTICKNVQRMNSEKNLTLVILNYAQGQISISGQHEETIIIRKGGQIELIDTMDLGFPIGLDDDITDFISDITLELQPGDGVVLYTDGITEAKDINKNQYGLEPLCEIISQNWHKSASEIKDAVILDVRRHIGKQKVFDDITLLVFKRREEVYKS